MLNNSTTQSDLLSNEQLQINLKKYGFWLDDISDDHIVQLIYRGKVIASFIPSINAGQIQDAIINYLEEHQ